MVASQNQNRDIMTHVADCSDEDAEQACRGFANTRSSRFGVAFDINLYPRS
jgi:hypothetical protein